MRILDGRIVPILGPHRRAGKNQSRLKKSEAIASDPRSHPVPNTEPDIEDFRNKLESPLFLSTVT